MANAGLNDLTDLAELLAIVRSLGGVREKKPGTFYLRGGAFLHFHVRGGRRWMDLKAPDGWQPEMALPADDHVAMKSAIVAAVATHGKWMKHTGH